MTAGFMLALAPNSDADNPPVGPPACPWGNWQIVRYPSVTLGDPNPMEPLTVNYEAKMFVFVINLPGLTERYRLCYDEHQYWSWPATINSITWEGTAISPASGSASLACASYYQAIFTPLTIGEKHIEFRADISASNPSWTPLSNEEPTLTVDFSVLPKKRIGYWQFNNTWLGENGQTPVAAAHLSNPSDWYGGALQMKDPNGPILQYLGIEPSGSPNVTRSLGTVRFWFKPAWSSTTQSGGTGPGAIAKLIEFYYGVGSLTAVFGLSLNDAGTTVELTSAGGGCAPYPTTHLSRTINWQANRWHQIAVTYSATETILYIDGAPVGTAGPGVTPMMQAVSRFNIGSSSTGANQAKGWFDELETFNYPLSALQIQHNYEQTILLDTDGDGLPNLTEIEVGTDPDDPDTDGDGCLDGEDDFPLIPEGCHHNLADTTPPIIELIQPANANLIP